MDKPRRTQMLETLLAETRKVGPRRKLLMLVAVAVAAGYLLTLKQGAQKEHAGQAAQKAAVEQARAATNEEIVEAMRTRFGGPSQNKDQVALVTRVGELIARKSDAAKAGKAVAFHLVSEPNSINAFGLADGNVYMTTAMLNRMRTEGQLAAVLAHAAAHALAGDGLSVVPGAANAKPNWQHTAQAEQAADALAVKLMSQAGYNPEAFAAMLEVLATAYHAGADVAFFTTHPNSADRLEAIHAAIVALYPQGVPAVLSE